MALGWIRWRAWVPLVAGDAAAQAWYLVTSTLPLRGRRGSYGTGLDPVARLGPASDAVALCVAGVALGDICAPVAWQAWDLVTSTTSTLQLRGRRGTAWDLVTSTFSLRRRRGTYGTGNLDSNVRCAQAASSARPCNQTACSVSLSVRRL